MPLWRRRGRRDAPGHSAPLRARRDPRGVKIPRNIRGADLVHALRRLGYDRVRQDGSHIRLTTQTNGTHHVTVPNHKPLKTGPLYGGVLKPVAAHHGLIVEELIAKLGL